MNEVRNWKNWLVVFAALLCVTVISCRSFVDKITPANLDEQVRVLANVEPNDFGLLGPTLHDLKNIKNQLIVQHRQEKLTHVRQVEDLDFIYPFAFGILDFDIQDAKEVQQIVIGSESNPVSILGILAGFGLTGIGTAIGRKYLKRPGDYTPEEVEVAITKVQKEGSNGEAKRPD